MKCECCGSERCLCSKFGGSPMGLQKCPIESDIMSIKQEIQSGCFKRAGELPDLQKKLEQSLSGGVCPSICQSPFDLTKKIACIQKQIHSGCYINAPQLPCLQEALDKLQLGRVAGPEASSFEINHLKQKIAFIQKQIEAGCFILAPQLPCLQEAFDKLKCGGSTLPVSCNLEPNSLRKKIACIQKQVESGCFMNAARLPCLQKALDKLKAGAVGGMVSGVGPAYCGFEPSPYDCSDFGSSPTGLQECRPGAGGSSSFDTSSPCYAGTSKECFGGEFSGGFGSESEPFAAAAGVPMGGPVGAGMGVRHGAKMEKCAIESEILSVQQEVMSGCFKRAAQLPALQRSLEQATTMSGGFAAGGVCPSICQSPPALRRKIACIQKQVEAGCFSLAPQLPFLKEVLCKLQPGCVGGGGGGGFGSAEACAMPPTGSTLFEGESATGAGAAGKSLTVDLHVHCDKDTHCDKRQVEGAHAGHGTGFGTGPYGYGCNRSSFLPGCNPQGGMPPTFIHSVVHHGQDQGFPPFEPLPLQKQPQQLWQQQAPCMQYYAPPPPPSVPPHGWPQPQWPPSHHHHPHYHHGTHGHPYPGLDTHHHGGHQF